VAADSVYFLKSLLIGLSVAAPVGPIALLCIQRTLDHGRGSGAVFGAGVAAADATYAMVAAFGITAVSSVLLSHASWIKLLGCLLLIFIGLRIAFARPAAAARGEPGPGWRAFGTAYGLTLSNPPTILSFAAIFASMNSLTPASGPMIFVAGVFAGSMLWWLILTALVAKSVRWLRPAVTDWINRASGAALIALALYGLATLA
jgi:threonine/homoserine/homoserine lactone efflux protein